jgi:hypothetical protein
MSAAAEPGTVEKDTVATAAVAEVLEAKQSAATFDAEEVPLSSFVLNGTDYSEARSMRVRRVGNGQTDRQTDRQPGEVQGRSRCRGGTTTGLLSIWLPVGEASPPRMALR